MRRIVRDLNTESIDVEVSNCEVRAPHVYAVRVHLHLRTHAILYQSPSSGPLTEVLVRADVHPSTGKEYVLTCAPVDNLALRKALSDFCTESLGPQAGEHLAKEVWRVLWQVVKEEVEAFIELEAARKRETSNVAWKPKGDGPFYAQEHGAFFEFFYETDDDVTYCRTVA